MPLGSKIGEKFGKIAEVAGGIVLILIGLNILLDFV
jgi:putative Mn2+ efflux pump MntP